MRCYIIFGRTKITVGQLPTQTNLFKSNDSELKITTHLCHQMYFKHSCIAQIFAFKTNCTNIYRKRQIVKSNE